MCPMTGRTGASCNPGASDAMDLRYFELHDLLCEASIALEARNQARAAALVAKALRWLESDWLASAAEIRAGLSELAPVDVDDGEDE
jgi:hypothetical protein